MENLKNTVSRPAVIYSNEKLLVLGRTFSSTTCQDVQYLNLTAGTTGVYAGTVDCGGIEGFNRPGMYDIVGGKVSIFGGTGATESCIQQTASGDDLGSEWECLSISESTLEGLVGYRDLSYKNEMRYSNFVL